MTQATKSVAARTAWARIALAAVVAVLAARPVGAQGQLWDVQQIADCTGPRQYVFGATSINDSGMVAFSPDMDAACNAGVSGYGIFRGDGTSTDLIATFSGGGFHQLFKARFPIDSDGVVALEGGMPDPLRFGFWTGTGGGNPGLTLHYPYGATIFDSIRMGGRNDHGEFGFRGYIAADSSEGVYLGDASTDGSDLIPIAHSSEERFGGTLSGLAWVVLMFNPGGVNDAGDVVFRASLDAGGEGLFIGNADGTTTIADTSTAAGMFSGFAENDIGSSKFMGVGLNESGEVAFRATLSAGGEAVYLYDGAGGLSLIADTTGDYERFFAVAVNDNGIIAFEAELDDGRRGIFTGADPASSKVLITGQTLLDMTVTAVGFGDLALNDNDQIAFYAGFDATAPGGTVQGVYRATIPEPATLSLLAIGGLALIRRRR